jgi:hypothetical protein
LGKTSIDLLFAGDVDFAKQTFDFFGQGLTQVIVEIEQSHPDAVLGQHARRGGPKPEAPPVITAVTSAFNFILLSPRRTS